MLRRTVLKAAPGALMALLFATATTLPGQAGAQTSPYPNKPVTIIVPFTAGGNTDAFARMVGDELDKALGQRFLVENKPGAGGNLGAAQLARATPDGYTLGMGTVSTHAINPSLYKKLPYNPDTAFAPVSLIATLPNVLVVNPKSSQVRPGTDRTAQGRTRRPYLCLLRTRHLAPSRGRTFRDPNRHQDEARALQGQRAIDHGRRGRPCGHGVRQHPDSGPQAKAGKVRALAVTSLDRAPLLPDVPAMAEFLPGFEATSWHGLFAPGGTPKEIVEKLSGEVQRIMKLPHIQERMQSMGAKPIGDTPEEFAQHISVERKKWAEVVKASGVSLE